MTDRVVIVLSSGAALALSVDVYRQALSEGSRLIGAVAAPGAAKADEPLLTAAELAAELKVPVTKIETGARQGTVPAMRCGRYWRFRRSAVEAALAANGGGA